MLGHSEGVFLLVFARAFFLFLDLHDREGAVGALLASDIESQHHLSKCIKRVVFLVACQLLLQLLIFFLLFLRLVLLQLIELFIADGFKLLFDFSLDCFVMFRQLL